MTTYSTNDLALRTMRDLNIIDSNEQPDSSDFNYVIQTIQSEFARMEADGIYFANHGTTVDSIDVALFTELSRRMGFAIGPVFGIMDAATSEAGKDASENVLRRLVAPVKQPQEMTMERAIRGTRIRDPIISQ